jgi:hypothetical protein
MDAAVSKFVKASNVVAMAVSCDSDNWLNRQFRNLLAQACEPEPTVDQKIALTPFD